MSATLSSLGVKLETPKLSQRNAFQVGTKLYKTMRGAAKSTAWHWILSKYSPVESVKRVRELICDCAVADEEYDYGVIQYKHEACPLHNRNDGYFENLKEKLVSIFLEEWSKS